MKSATFIKIKRGVLLQLIGQDDGSNRISSLYSATNISFGETSFADVDGTVCIYVVSSVGSNVIDRAPDEGCIEASSGAGGVGGFN